MVDLCLQKSVKQSLAMAFAPSLQAKFVKSIPSRPSWFLRLLGPSRTTREKALKNWQIALTQPCTSVGGLNSMTADLIVEFYLRFRVTSASLRVRLTTYRGGRNWLGFFAPTPGFCQPLVVVPFKNAIGCGGRCQFNAKKFPMAWCASSCYTEFAHNPFTFSTQCRVG